jgi:hypothetical protein
MLKRVSLSVSIMLIVACESGASLIATDHFLRNAADPLAPNLANGEYVASGAANQLRRATASGAGQNPTVAGFTGAWTGNVTGGTGAVAQWTAEVDGISMPQTAMTQAGGRARFGGASATNTLQRRVQRSLSAYAPSNTYYMSLTSQVTVGDAADTGLPGFVGIGFTSAGNDAHYASGNALRGWMIGAANDGANTDYVVRHVGSSGAMQMDVIQDNIVQSDDVQTVIARYTVVRVDLNDEPGNPLGNSKLTIWHQPVLGSLTSEADATLAAAPIVLRSFALGTAGDMTQLTMMGLNWSRPASFDEPRLGTTWGAVVVVPEPMAGMLVLPAMLLMSRRR